MRNKLSSQETKFVQAITQGMGKRDAAIFAGYAPNSAHVSASRLLSREHVLHAIRDAAEKQINAGVAIGARVLVELAEKGKSEAVRFQAATSLLDRGGLPFIRQSETRHVIEDRRSDAELMEHVRNLAHELGVPLEAKLIESTPTEVADVKAER